MGKVIRLEALQAFVDLEAALDGGTGAANPEMNSRGDLA